ncbi:MAG: GNAT family N-acetyltransferase [Aggregatilineales bacterium]
MIDPIPFLPARDWTEVCTLWTRTLGDTWPLPPDRLLSAISTPISGQRGAQFVVLSAERVIGFIAVQNCRNPNGTYTGYLVCILVDPDFQRQGIGSALLETSAAWLKADGATRMVSGGKYPRLWPGVPDNLPGPLAFFQACGWAMDKIDYDLGRPLSDYTTPDSLTVQLAAEAILIEPAIAGDASDILAFQDREFAAWADTYRYVISVGDISDVLLARDSVKGIVGALLMVGPWSNPSRIDAAWTTLHGESLGGLGEVGTAKDERGRGVGLGLVARGSELLKARGVSYAHIGYTSLLDFYGKLGYHPWQKYRIGVRML